MPAHLAPNEHLWLSILNFILRFRLWTASKVTWQRSNYYFSRDRTCRMDGSGPFHCR